MNDIFKAIKMGDLKKVKSIINKRPDSIHERDEPHKRTSLHYAVFINKIEIVKFLVTRVENIDETDGYGCTSLHWASRRGYLNVLNLLLVNGANANARQGLMGKTPLHLASENGFADVVDSLLSYGADPDIIIEERPYKLHEILETDPDFKWELTPLDIARNSEVIKVFQRYSMKIR